MDINTHDIYFTAFKDYPDVMDVKQVGSLLGISTKTVYKLIREGSLTALKIGRKVRIPKVVLLKHMKLFGSTLATQTI